MAKHKLGYITIIGIIYLMGTLYSIMSFANSACTQLFAPQTNNIESAKHVELTPKIVKKNLFTALCQNLLINGYSLADTLYIMRRTPYAIMSLTSPIDYIVIIENTLQHLMQNKPTPGLNPNSYLYKNANLKDANNFLQAAQMIIDLEYAGKTKEEIMAILGHSTYGANLNNIGLQYFLDTHYGYKDKFTAWIKQSTQLLNNNKKTIFLKRREIYPFTMDTLNDHSFLYQQLQKNPAVKDEIDLDFTFTDFRHEDFVTTDFGKIILQPTDDAAVTTYLARAKDNRTIKFNLILGKLKIPDSFYANVYKNYRDRIRDAIIKLVKKIDDTIPLLRQSFGILTESGNKDNIVGTIRIVDGTMVRKDDIVLRQEVSNEYLLPCEKAFAARNIKSNAMRYLQSLREENPFQRIFEVGKLSLVGSGSVRNRARKIFAYWFLKHYLIKYPDGFFVAHVASEAHLRLYRPFGFKMIEELMPDGEHKEYILIATGKEIMRNILHSHGDDISPDLKDALLFEDYWPDHKGYD